MRTTRFDSHWEAKIGRHSGTARKTVSPRSWQSLLSQGCELFEGEHRLSTLKLRLRRLTGRKWPASARHPGSVSLQWCVKLATFDLYQSFKIRETWGPGFVRRPG